MTTYDQSILAACTAAPQTEQEIARRAGCDKGGTGDMLSTELDAKVASAEDHLRVFIALSDHPGEHMIFYQEILDALTLLREEVDRLRAGAEL